MIETVYLVGVETAFERAVTRIVQLFHDDAKVIYSDHLVVDEMALAITVEQMDKSRLIGRLYVFGQLRDQITTSFEQEVDSGKQIKRQAIGRIVLSLLQNYTNIIQPWGILTGIRPTKLYHTLRRNGYHKNKIRTILLEDYLVSEEKVHLLEQIVELQLHVLPHFDQLIDEVSIYIGIPFCPTKCAYCTFPAYGIEGQGDLVTKFLTSLHYEMEQVGKWLLENNIGITTIYFGGGTPTSISAEEMDQLYEKLYEFFPNVQNVRELTVEAGRPDTIDEEKIRVLKKWKVDRISVNPQSFKEETLQAIGRHHSAKETIVKYKLAYEKGLKNINMDLIIGLPGEGVGDFSNSLSVLEELLPSSVTVHTLSYKRASTMTKYKEKYHVASREEIHEMMELAKHWMKLNHYQPYYLYRQKNILGNLENVGYALDGDESIYNIVIMEEAQTIIGLGSGAMSKWVDPNTREIERFANPKDPRQYVERIKQVTQGKLEALTALFAR